MAGGVDGEVESGCEVRVPARVREDLAVAVNHGDRQARHLLTLPVLVEELPEIRHAAILSNAGSCPLIMMRVAEAITRAMGCALTEGDRCRAALVWAERRGSSPTTRASWPPVP